MTSMVSGLQYKNPSAKVCRFPMGSSILRCIICQGLASVQGSRLTATIPVRNAEKNSPATNSNHASVSDT